MWAILIQAPQSCSSVPRIFHRYYVLQSFVHSLSPVNLHVIYAHSLTHSRSSLDHLPNLICKFSIDGCHLYWLGIDESLGMVSKDAPAPPPPIVSVCRANMYREA